MKISSCENILFIVLAVLFLCDPQARAHTASTNLNMFSPNLLQERYSRVESTSQLLPGELSLNLFGDIGFNTMAIYGSGPVNAEDTMSFLHLGVAIGLSPRFELGAKFPFLLNQGLDSSQIGRSIRLYESGFTDSIVYLKYKVLEKKAHGFSLIGQLGQSFSKNVFYNGESGGADLFVGAIYERLWNTWALAFNAGYAVRNPGEQGASYLYYEPIKSSILASVGLSKRFNESHALSLEVISTMNRLEIDQSDRGKNSLEASLSYRRFWNQFIFVAGAGVGMQDGISEPQMRGFAGVNYKLRPLWGKGKSESSQGSQPVAARTDAVSDTTAVTEKSEADVITTATPEPEVNVVTAPPAVPNDAVAPEESDVGDDLLEEDGGLVGASAVTTTPPVAAAVEEEILDESNPYKDKTYEEVVTLEKDQKDLEKNLEEFTQKNIGSTQEYQKLILEHIEFEFDSDQLDEMSLQILAGVLKYLEQTEFESLKIIGHTDFFGSVLYNENLSLRRAITVMKYLKEHGIPQDKMTFDGYGKRRPLKTGASEEFRRKNRRVEIILKKNK